MASKPLWTKGLAEKAGRKLAQLGFLAFFLYPLVPIVVRHLTQRSSFFLTSWLLPWDPLLLVGRILSRNWSTLILGAPLLILAASVILGRYFCGWVCPLGTVLDLIRPLAR